MGGWVRKSAIRGWRKYVCLSRGRAVSTSEESSVGSMCGEVRIGASRAIRKVSDGFLGQVLVALLAFVGFFRPEC